MSRQTSPVRKPLIPEEPLPPRLWIGLPCSALLASALSVALIASVSALGGGALLVAMEDAWGRFLGSVTISALMFLSFLLRPRLLPPRPNQPEPGQKKHHEPSLFVRVVTFILWYFAVFATTTFLLRRFSEPLGLEHLVLPRDGVSLALTLSLFWTVVLVITVFVLDARRRKAQPT